MSQRIGKSDAQTARTGSAAQSMARAAQLARSGPVPAMVSGDPPDAVRALVRMLARQEARRHLRQRGLAAPDMAGVLLLLGLVCALVLAAVSW